VSSLQASDSDILPRERLQLGKTIAIDEQGTKDFTALIGKFLPLPLGIAVPGIVCRNLDFVF